MRREERRAVIDSYVGREDGDLFFFYRPKADEVRGAADVERLYLVLHPFAGKSYRLLELEGAVMPLDTGPGATIHGRVLKVDNKQSVIRHALGPIRSVIAGSAPIVQQAAVPCAEGVYSLLLHGDQTHLVYLLELPNLPFDLQRQLGINGQDEFLLGVYNPTIADEQEAARQPVLPPELQKRFNRRTTLYDNIVEVLDYPNIRFVLTRRGEQPAGQHAAELSPRWQELDTAEIFAALADRTHWRDRAPMDRGQWQ